MPHVKASTSMPIKQTSLLEAQFLFYGENIPLLVVKTSWPSRYHLAPNTCLVLQTLEDDTITSRPMGKRMYWERSRITSVFPSLYFHVERIVFLGREHFMSKQGSLKRGTSTKGPNLGDVNQMSVHRWDGLLYSAAGAHGLSAHCQPQQEGL